jgi:hypothetical protein
MRRYVLCVGKSGVGSPGGVPLGVYPDTLAAMEARPSRCGWDTVPRTDLGGNAVLWRDAFHDDPEPGDYYAVYQVEAPEAAPPLTPADRGAALAEIQKLVQWAKHTSLRSWAAPMERLCWLLGLTPEERGFVQAISGDAKEAGASLPAFVDWLADQGREGERRFVQLAAFQRGIEAERRRTKEVLMRSMERQTERDRVMEIIPVPLRDVCEIAGGGREEWAGEAEAS